MPSIAQQLQTTVKRRIQRDVEGPIHRSVLAYLRASLPPAWIIHHVANKPRSMRQGLREKKLGTVAGWPDIGIFGPSPRGSSAWFMEIKAPGGRVSDEQREVHDRLQECGFQVRIVRSVEDARKAVSDWKLPSNDIQIYGSRRAHV